MTEYHAPKFQEEYSAKFPALALLTNLGWQFYSSGQALDVSYVKFQMFFCVDFLTCTSYSEPNITATPLNDAQPWRFFYACSGGFHA